MSYQPCLCQRPLIPTTPTNSLIIYHLRKYWTKLINCTTQVCDNVLLIVCGNVCLNLNVHYPPPPPPPVITSPPEGVAMYCFRPVCLSVCVCMPVCLADILVFYFSASRIAIDLKCIQDTYRVVLNSLKN